MESIREIDTQKRQAPEPGSFFDLPKSNHATKLMFTQQSLIRLDRIYLRSQIKEPP